LTRYQDTAPDTFLMPVNLTEDKRLFLRNGEVSTPFEVITFRLVEHYRAAGHQVAAYEEVSRAEFNPEGLTEVKIRGLEKDFADLNGGAE
jgi:hypothetical protein